MITKALVFVGAFNPPTIAHIETADIARKKLDYDKVIFVPSKFEYIRYDQDKDYAWSDNERLEMLHRIAESKDWMEVSDYELKLQHQPRTYQTLCALKKETGWELKLLIGSDKLTELEHGWLHIKEITEEFGIVVMTRNLDDVEQVIEEDSYLCSLNPYLDIVAIPKKYQSVSSSKVRQRFKDPNCSIEDRLKDLPTELNNYPFQKSEKNNEEQND